MKSKAKKEYYAALLSELDYKKRVGELLEVEDVKVQIQKICTICRDRLLSLPDQIAPEIMGERSVHGASIILYKRINACLSDLVADLSKVTSVDKCSDSNCSS